MYSSRQKAVPNRAFRFATRPRVIRLMRHIINISVSGLLPLPSSVYTNLYKVASAEWNRVLRWVDGDPEALVGNPWKQGALLRLKENNLERVNDILNRREF